MSLAPGVRLGPYEVLSAIGAGGMGEVYRARDTRLGRDVALKILPDAFASDSDRLARFAREAQVLASLNHPNIGGIYGLEETDGIGALVLELVEGQTLADRIAQGPISLDEALPIARQISGALEAAHEQGIIHRDLKPANIKVRDDGTVKVLDFGLAKALEPASAGGADVTASPTITSPAMTHMGVILGTAAYMSPEQAAGKSVDKRSDLWAFGVVLMEMLTGRPVFTGETVSHVLAAVLKSDPEWTALPAETPASIRRLLRRCLEKDRQRRLDSAGAARLEIDEVQVPTSETLAAPRRSRRVAPLTFGLAMLTGALIAALVTWAVMQPAPQDPALSSRFAITPSPTNPLGISPFERVVALSPDGRHLAYQSPTLGTGGRLMLRPIDQLDARHLAGITNARGLFFSAESRWIGFFQGTDLKKVSITGGPTITLCGFDGGPRGASWGHDDIIVFATADPNTGLWRVPAGGGKPTVLTTPNAAQLEGDHIFPSVLPSGRGVLFTIAAPDQAENSDVAVLDLQTMQYKTLMRGGSQPEYVEPPTGSGQAGYLVYAAAGALRAVRFDLATLNVLSDPVPVLEHVRMAPTGAANYAVSRAGTLVYVPGGAAVQPTRSLVWVDRKGREEPIKAAPLRAYAIPRISPDGTRVAIDIRDQENDIWIWDLARETLRKLTYGPGMDQQPVWTPDGRRLIFASNRAGPSNLYGQAVDGTGPVDRLTTSGNSQFPTSMTPDGNTVVGHEDGPTSFDVVLFRLANLSASRPGSDAVSAGAGRSEVQPLVRTRFIEHNAEISPDGRYIAYQSNESGQIEIYVQPFPQVDGGKWQISTGGGTRAVWARNGRELFYVEGSNALVAVPVETSGPMFAWGKPVKLFDNKYAASLTFRSYDTAPDGQRFLMLKGDAAADENPTADGILVVLNWFEELKRLVPTN